MNLYNLVKIANRLDELGFIKEANLADNYIKQASGLMQLKKFLQEYYKHTALNAGQAARDIRYILNHPDADNIAQEGTPKHMWESLKHRFPSLFNNIYYATIPPQTHHTKEDLAYMDRASGKDWFLHGYKPWEYKDPLEDLNQHLPQEELQPGRKKI